MRLQLARTSKCTLALAATLLAAGCGARGAGGSAPSTHPLGIPPPGIVGTYLEHDVAHPHKLTGVAGVRVLLYDGRVNQGGPLIKDSKQPRPLAHTTTGAGGRFWFRHVRVRRYFVLAVGRALTPGRFVRVPSPTASVRVRLVGCLGCPRPLAAATPG